MKAIKLRGAIMLYQNRWRQPNQQNSYNLQRDFLKDVDWEDLMRWQKILTPFRQLCAEWRIIHLIRSDPILGSDRIGSQSQFDPSPNLDPPPPFSLSSFNHAVEHLSLPQSCCRIALEFKHPLIFIPHSSKLKNREA